VRTISLCITFLVLLSGCHNDSQHDPLCLEGDVPEGPHRREFAMPDEELVRAAAVAAGVAGDVSDVAPGRYVVDGVVITVVRSHPKVERVEVAGRTIDPQAWFREMGIDGSSVQAIAPEAPASKFLGWGLGVGNVAVSHVQMSNGTAPNGLGVVPVAALLATAGNVSVAFAPDPGFDLDLPRMGSAPGIAIIAAQCEAGMPLTSLPPGHASIVAAPLWNGARGVLVTVQLDACSTAAVLVLADESSVQFLDLPPTCGSKGS
jgi:hypothetical protein